MVTSSFTHGVVTADDFHNAAKALWLGGGLGMQVDEDITGLRGDLLPADAHRGGRCRAITHQVMRDKAVGAKIPQQLVQLFGLGFVGGMHVNAVFLLKGFLDDAAGSREPLAGIGVCQGVKRDFHGGRAAQDGQTPLYGGHPLNKTIIVPQLQAA